MAADFDKPNEPQMHQGISTASFVCSKCKNVFSRIIAHCDSPYCSWCRSCFHDRPR